MTSNDWNPDDHPRDRSGVFATKTHTEPEAELPTGLILTAEVARGRLIGKHAVESSFPGENELDTLIANRLFIGDDLADPLIKAWGLGGNNAPMESLEEELDALTGGLNNYVERPDLSSDLIASASEVAYYRSSAFMDDGERHTMLGSDVLRSADLETDLRAGRAEVSNDTASVLAESLLQRLPDGKAPVDFPRLAEAAAFPAYFAPEDTDKVDALHRELGSIYDRLQSAQRPRADALFTWSLHGADTEANPPLV